MPNNGIYIEEQIKPGVRRLAEEQPKEKEQDGDRKVLQTLLKQIEPGPTRILLARLLIHEGLIEEG